ncbi:helix-turn-helix domain-containing protein [Polaromonas sp. A23]|uniref:helix-turn-helix domain-containing protein n=1 Tax=Polaromonas sp. A23 TaxID=1944133 RepID=UPI00098464D7|nr:helix-turn-helix domain-containing protein [Polaromonas sp. A23]OOG47410.1 AraC family transcriptional regulator [Polaromonas sp. A23]
MVKPYSSAIPSFALYGEAASPGQEMLHIEEVQSRSRLYHWEISPHVHQGLYQVLWVQRGEAAIALDERREVARGPAATVVPPGVVHGFRFAPDTDGLVLTLSPRFLVEGEFQSVGEAFRNLFSTPGVLRFEDGEAAAVRLDALLRELHAEFTSPGNAEAPVAGWLARAVVWRLAQARAQGRQSGEGRGRHQALFTRFLLLVEEHFLAHWSLEQYASRLGLSTARLNRLARAESGRSALELIHERLTREACRRLMYIAAPAANLAAELGFEDPAYFSRFFKRRTGLSPHRWRQAHRGSEPLSG